MNNQNLRAIIIKLQDYLSDDDRQRLHFYLGNDIPRRIRDDLTINGTLSLMDTLICQDKINENDFTFLIYIFQQIRCIEAVQFLQKHMQRIQSKNIDQQGQCLTTIMQSTTDQFTLNIEDEDRMALPNNYSVKDNVTIAQEKSYENNMMTNNDQDGINREEKSNNELMIKKILIILSVGIVFLFMILIGLIIGILMVKFELKKKMEYCQNEQIKTNNTIEYLKTIQMKDNTTMEELTKKTNDLQEKLQISIGTTCGCAQWCKNHDDSSYGVCGDGHTCICRNTPITKQNLGNGCTCDAWCRKYGYENGGICGDGYTCICSMEKNNTSESMK